MSSSSSPPSAPSLPPPPSPHSSSSLPPPPSPNPPPSIHALSESVINRIAAGEVIHRPSHALKELLENSLDAQSTRLSLTLKDGGLRLLQVTDNGCGIRKEDLAILCRRFTTSKLSAFDDLQSIATFGFRGEALASITHVARTSVTTRTRDSPCAYRAFYSDGELAPARPGESEQPRPCAGVAGTTIVVEDLFYNVPIRRAALRSPSEEFALCVDVVTKYSIHYSHVAFTCKKAGTATAELNTLPGMTPLDNIRALYGPVLAKELIPFKGESTQPRLAVSGYLSNLNYSVKRLTFVLFVNGRLVESPAVKAVVAGVYSRHLPKNGHGWVYMSVEAAKDEVDVNVHPTKREISLLHEDELLALVEQAMEAALKGTESSRTFYATPLIHPPTTSTVEQSMSDEGKEEAGDRQLSEGDAESKDAGEMGDEEHLVSLTQIGREKRVYRPQQLVRTDARQGKLASFFTQHHAAATAPSSASPSPPRTALTRKRSRHPTTELTSVHRLMAAAQSNESAVLVDLFADHTFVGVVNGTYSLLQHKTALYLVDHTRVSEALFYQLILQSFSTHTPMTLSTPIKCTDMLDLLPPSPSSLSPDVSTLFRSASMLRDYWALTVTEDGSLSTIPDLLSHYTPPLVALPLFLRALCVEVDWSEEERCLKGVSRALSHWYRIQPGMYIEEKEQKGGGLEEGKDGGEGMGEAEEEELLGGQVRWCIEHSLFPACRHSFSPPHTFLTDGTVTQVASLENLYKIFERC